MITSDNIKGVIKSISNKDKSRIRNTNKEFIVLQLHCTNNTAYVEVTCTNRYTIYQYVAKNGGCILYSEDIVFNNI